MSARRCLFCLSGGRRRGGNWAAHRRRARPEHVRPVRLSGESLPDSCGCNRLRYVLADWGQAPSVMAVGACPPFSRCSADGHSAVRQKKLHESRRGITSRIPRLSWKSATLRVARRLLEERKRKRPRWRLPPLVKTRAHLLPLSPADSLHHGPEPLHSGWGPLPLSRTARPQGLRVLASPPVVPCASLPPQ
jgi:hypothetical protein